MKLWWPHSEAMIAFLMGYSDSGDPALLHLFYQVAEYTFRQVSAVSLSTRSPGSKRGRNKDVCKGVPEPFLQLLLAHSLDAALSCSESPKTAFCLANQEALCLKEHTFLDDQTLIE